MKRKCKCNRKIMDFSVKFPSVPLLLFFSVVLQRVNFLLYLTASRRCSRFLASIQATKDNFTKHLISNSTASVARIIVVHLLPSAKLQRTITTIKVLIAKFRQSLTTYNCDNFNCVPQREPSCRFLWRPCAMAFKITDFR